VNCSCSSFGIYAVSVADLSLGRSEILRHTRPHCELYALDRMGTCPSCGHDDMVPPAPPAAAAAADPPPLPPPPPPPPPTYRCLWGDVDRCGDGRTTWMPAPRATSGSLGEECDDGGNEDGDGCSATCKIEPGWSCSPPSTFKKSVCQMWPTCSARMMGEFCQFYCSGSVTFCSPVHLAEL